MTVKQETISPRGIREGVLGIAFAGTFAVGLTAGLIVPRLTASAARMPIEAAPFAAAVASAGPSAAFEAYRAGERGDTSTATSAYESYRAGERGDR